MTYRNFYEIRKMTSFSANLITFIEKKRAMILIGLLITCSIILSLSIISIKVTAERVIDREKYVTSVKIEKGDSLWSIASKYITDEYDDMNSYIDEIKYSNGLTSEVIHEGRYIIVPYYAVKR